MGVLGAIARNLDTVVGPMVMLIYPLYASIRAIESPSALDDQQWLTYWVLYSLITLFELSCWRALAWFPLWPYMKLIFSLWLVLPIFNGAAYVYENVVKVHIPNLIKLNPDLTSSERRAIQMMTPEARGSVERFIAKYGSDAFEKVVKAGW
ncbi:hypothetical protein AMTRI_Chr01g134240 [Amborella trichopoda]